MTQQQTPPVVLVDGSSYLFRAYHALPPLMTSKSHPTGAIKGVISMIRKLEQDFPGSKMVVVFDAKGKTFRNDLYEDYKATRPPMPDDLAMQIQPIHDMVRAMGLPLLIVSGVEADDVIGTLAHEATSKGIDVVVSTGDKDMAQLVSDHVTLINTMTDTRMDRDGVVEKFGIGPEQIVDYLALVGDKVDNIPGVNKCGPKTAVKWLQAWDNLDDIIEHADEVKGKIGEYLREATETLPLSRQLATIKTDVDLEFGLEDLKLRTQDDGQLLELFREYELRSWIAELENSDSADEKSADDAVDNSTNPASKEKTYTIVTDQAELDTWIDRLNKAPLFAFDTETTSLRYMDADVVGVSLAIEPGEAAYVPFGRPGTTGPGNSAGPVETFAGRPEESQARPEPQIRQERAGQPRHPPGRHCGRHHAGVLRTQFRRVSSRHGLAGQAILGRADHHFRIHRRQRRQATDLQPD